MFALGAALAAVALGALAGSDECGMGCMVAIAPAVVCVVSLCFWAACAASGNSKQRASDVVLVVVGVLGSCTQGLMAVVVADQSAPSALGFAVEFAACVAMVVVGSMHIHGWP